MTEMEKEVSRAEAELECVKNLMSNIFRLKRALK